MFIVEICKYMGWDYLTFYDQPSWFVDTIVLRMQGENRGHKYLRKKNK